MGIFTHHNYCSREMKRNLKPQKMAQLNGHELPWPWNLESEEEFYSAPIPMTSDDIWKKFDLPTPPMSPSRDNDSSADLDLEDEFMNLEFDPEFYDEKLLPVKELTFPESPPAVNVTLLDNLIQDPMWSASPDGDTSSVENSKRMRCDSCSRPTFDMNSAECVDPKAVFPYPIGGDIAETRVTNLGIETPSDSEEEIDVVTVEKQKQQASVPVKRKCTSSDSETDIPESSKLEFKPNTRTVTLTIESTPLQTFAQKVTVKPRVDCPTDVHNYSLPSTSLKRLRSCPASPDSSRHNKKVKREFGVQELRQVAHKLVKSRSCPGSRNCSDSEDCLEPGKRTQHNVLERKRRTDLKNSFHSLRDCVPDLAGQEKAPKVVILRKAAEYVHKLNSDHRRYEREMNSLKNKQEQLKRTLAKLREL